MESFVKERCHFINWYITLGSMKVVLQDLFLFCFSLFVVGCILSKTHLHPSDNTSDLSTASMFVCFSSAHIIPRPHICKINCYLLWMPWEFKYPCVHIVFFFLPLSEKVRQLIHYYKIKSEFLKKMTVVFILVGFKLTFV